MLTRRFTQRGDTMVELVLAFAIFSLAAISTMAILNQGVAISQRSLEKTLVRQQIDAQGEMLRYIRNTDNPVWDTILAKVTTTPLSLTSDCPTPSSLSQPGMNAFFLVNDSTSPNGFTLQTVDAPQYTTPTYYSQVDYSAKQSAGLWMQVARAENDSSQPINAYDFYIQGCWDSVGLDVPMRVGTIVRLYDK